MQYFTYEAFDSLTRNYLDQNRGNEKISDFLDSALAMLKGPSFTKFASAALRAALTILNKIN